MLLKLDVVPCITRHARDILLKYSLDKPAASRPRQPNGRKQIEHLAVQTHNQLLEWPHD